MTAKYLVHEALHERLNNLKKPCSGDIYGYIDKDVTYLVCATNSETEPIHRLGLILPAPFIVCGGFVKDIKDTDRLKQEHGLLVTIADGKILLEVKSEEWKEKKYSIITEEEFHDKFVLCRTIFTSDLLCQNDQTAIQARINNVKNALSASVFKLKDGDLFVEENQIISTNKGTKNESKKLNEFLPNSNKKGYSNLTTLDFELFVNSFSDEKLEANVVGISRKTTVLQPILKGECVAYVAKNTLIRQVGGTLKESIFRSLDLAEYWLLNSCTSIAFDQLDSLNVLPYKAGHIFTLLYPLGISSESLKSYKTTVQQAFLLPPNFPFFDRKNKYEFDAEKKAFHLYNTHVGIKTPEIGGLTGLTKGIYSYHHYMQDKFNDNKWGCAYRSLQTIVSWFRHQGYTEKSVPTHREIQECLVKIGDKDRTFIGSKQWIGSTEVGFVLETYLGVTSRFITVTSGDDLGDKGRELVHHFKTQGTPIMIGGGVLAHTILGVTWNSDSGDIRYLILDPHYTGSEDISVIQKQGWCGWKGPTFWNSKAYYNLCLPQRPLKI